MRLFSPQSDGQPTMIGFDSESGVRRCGIVVSGPPPPIDRATRDAVIVGLDNVVVKATQYAAAWTKFLDDYLLRHLQRTGEDRAPSPTTTTAASWPANPTV